MKGELKLVFNSHVRASSHTPEALALKIDLERAMLGDPDLMVGRIAPGGTILARAIAAGEATPEKKKKKEFDRLIHRLIILDTIRAVHQRIAELDELIEHLRKEIENNLERLAELDEQLDQRTAAIEKISEYLRDGKIDRLPDGSLADPAMNAFLQSYLHKNNLQADDLNAYSEADIRMFLDKEVEDQRLAREQEYKEQRRLTQDTDQKTTAMHEAMHEREQLQQIVDEYERIQAETPGHEKDRALNELMNSLDNSQLEKLQKAQISNEGGTGAIKEKTNEADLINVRTDEQKTAPSYMKDLGM